MLRIISEFKPKWVVGENVYGLINWNGGMVFDEVQSDLETQGYKVIPVVLPACAVNAPHRRDRVWFIAYRNSDGLQTERPEQQAAGIEQCGELDGNASNTDSDGRYGSDCKHEIDSGKGREYAFSNFEQSNGSGDASDAGGGGWIQDNEQYASEKHKYARTSWERFPTQSPICCGNDGLFSGSHRDPFYETIDMDRDTIISNALAAGKIEVDFETGKIYSRCIRGREGQKIELQGANCNGYRVHNISFNGVKKSCRAHQIVWIAANGLYDRDTLVIDHINRDKTDNRLVNLRLATASENRRNCEDYTGQFSNEDKERIAVLYHTSGMSMRELAEDLGISKSRVQQIIQEQKILDGITFPKWRSESIKAYGNAVVPQVVIQIFNTINLFEKQKSEQC